MFLLVKGREEYEYFDFFTGDCHPHCPQEWVAYRGSCYSFSTEKKDWNSSQESCKAQGAHLLVINDTLEMVMVFFGFENRPFPCRYPSDWHTNSAVIWQYFGFKGEEGFMIVVLHITKVCRKQRSKGENGEMRVAVRYSEYPMKDGRRQPSPLFLSTSSPVLNKTDMNDYSGTEQSLYSLPTN